jgi:hypothetical protein
VPSYVLVPSQRPPKSGELDANICPLDGIIGPNRKRSVPVKIKLIDERTLNVDGTNHQIIAATAIDGDCTYLIDAKSVRNRERRHQFARFGAARQGTRCFAAVAE